MAAPNIRVEAGDMLEVLPRLAAEGVRVQAVVTDPPYGIAFMGRKWDDAVAFRPATWRLCYDLLPPGGYLLACGGTRTFHRLACAIEDAGFEIRDTISWLFASGFPKALNVSKAIDKAAGATRDVVGVRRYADGTQGHWGLSDKYAQDAHTKSLNGATPKLDTAPATDAARQWEGWATSLKPAMELICMARKPLQGTVAANVQAFGTGAINVGACRIAGADAKEGRERHGGGKIWEGSGFSDGKAPMPSGRWPANVCHDNSAEVVGAFPDTGLSSGGSGPASQDFTSKNGIYGEFGKMQRANAGGLGDSGSAARFFKSASFTEDEKRFWYSSKADHGDRLGSVHPTVKPVDLMRWLVRLVTPPGGTVLDCFAGSGTTAMACMAEGFDCIAVEREAEYVADLRRRIAHVHGTDTPLFMAAD